MNVPNFIEMQNTKYYLLMVGTQGQAKWAKVA